MFAKIFCVALILCVAAAKFQMVTAVGMRYDDVSATNVFFGDGSYVVHVPQSGNTRIGSTVCNGRPDGSMILVGNSASSGSDPTLVLCNNDEAFTVGENARPPFVLSDGDLSCPAGFRLANVHEAGIWLRSLGQINNNGLRVGITSIGPVCDSSCTPTTGSAGDVELIADMGDNGHVFWAELNSHSTSTLKLCISHQAPLQFAYPDPEGCGDTDTGAATQNFVSSSNAQKDSFCQEAFGRSFRAAYTSSLLEQVRGAFSGYFIRRYLFARADQEEADQHRSPIALFTAAIDDNFSNIASTGFQGASYAAGFNTNTFSPVMGSEGGTDMTAGECNQCAFAVRNGINIYSDAASHCSFVTTGSCGAAPTGCPRDNNFYVACERIVISESEEP